LLEQRILRLREDGNQFILREFRQRHHHGEASDKLGNHSETQQITAEVPEIAEGIKGSLAEFVTALQGGPTPQGECHDNIYSLAMVFAAIESNRRGEKVQIEEILRG
jgi:predicted dehydrogenase